MYRVKRIQREKASVRNAPSKKASGKKAPSKKASGKRLQVKRLFVKGFRGKDSIYILATQIVIIVHVVIIYVRIISCSIS